MKLRIIEVEWDDITSKQGWMPVDCDPAHYKPLRCKTIGYYVSEDKNVVIVSSTFGHGDAPDNPDRWGGLEVIPKGCIVRVKKFK